MNQQEKILYFFKEISKIPRSSGDEKAISDYLVSFAKERKLYVQQDSLYNVIIKKCRTAKDSKSDAVIFQGHMDMVYIKKQDSTHEYKNGINILQENGILFSADGTTLGADNAIAIAYILTLLDSNEILHPDLEVIITTQEETGLVGAKDIDCFTLNGKYLINLDGENEGVFFTSCAGGVRNYLKLPIKKEWINTKSTLILEIMGLKGGHSGVDINEGRGNAIKLMARLLYMLSEYEIKLIDIISDGKANSIPEYIRAAIAVNEKDKINILAKIKDIEAVFKNELAFTDKVEISAADTPQQERIEVYTKETMDKVIYALTLMPCGVIKKSFAIEGLVETSINIGAITVMGENIVILSSIRSSQASQKKEIAYIIDTIATVINGKSCYFNDYPQWEYKKLSPLRELALNSYKKLFNKQPIEAAIHAGLECGYFDEKIKDADIISLGANIFDVHTVNERAEIVSIYNIWELLKEILKELT